MFKKLLSIFLSALIATSANAQVVIDNATINDVTVKSGIRRDSAILQTMLGYSGLIGYKDYGDDQTTADMDFSAGDPTATVSVSRSATNPATYMTWDGTNCVMNVSTTSNVQLYDECYYDETGAHEANLGYKAWRSSTNLLTRTDGTAYADGLWTGWILEETVGTVTKSTIDATSIINIPGATFQKIEYIGTGSDAGAYISLRRDNIGTFTQNDYVTLSFLVYVDSTQTGVTFRSKIAFYASNGTTETESQSNKVLTLPTNKLVLVTHSYLITNASTVYVRPEIQALSISNGDVVNFYVGSPQLEKLPYATPFIPTTTAALTRNRDVTKHFNLGNSHADEETIIMEVTPGATFESTRSRNLYQTDTVNREISDPSASNVYLKALPNATQSTSVVASSTTIPQKNTTYIFAMVFKHSSPYVQVYVDGVLEGVYTSGDWINPVFGSYFYIGSSRNSDTQFDGNIRRWAKWKRELSATEIAENTALWRANP